MLLCVNLTKEILINVHCSIDFIKKLKYSHNESKLQIYCQFFKCNMSVHAQEINMLQT